MNFNWTGDLRDDRTLIVNGFTAHCECLCDSLRVHDTEEPSGADDFNVEIWFVGVYRDYTPPAKDEDILFHSGEYGGMVTSGEMARAIAESVINSYLSSAQAAEDRVK